MATTLLLRLQHGCIALRSQVLCIVTGSESDIAAFKDLQDVQPATSTVKCTYQESWVVVDNAWSFAVLGICSSN